MVPFIQEQQRETGARRILVDVGGEAPEVLRQVVLTADRVISPVGAEQGELSRLPATAVIVRPTGVPMSVLLTRVPKVGQGRARDARYDLQDDGYHVLDTEIPQHLETYSDIWGTIPKELGMYGDLADELLKGGR